ncbi:MAG: diguanylate cyclase [Actinomycetes bacterium]
MTDLEQRAFPVVPSSANDAQRALRQYGSETLLMVTRDGVVMSGSESFILGHSVGHAVNHVAEFLHPDDLPTVFALIETVRVVPSFRDQLTIRARHADRSWRRLAVTVFSVADEVLGDGAVLRIRDITDDPCDGSTVGVADGQSFLSLAEALPLGVLSADARSWVVFSNAAAEEIFNCPTDDLLGRGWERLVHVDDRHNVLVAIQDVIMTGRSRQVMFRIQTVGLTRWASARIVPLGPNDAPTGWIATIDDVTDRRRAESELVRQATLDGLTGLPNRAVLEERLEQACGRARDGGAEVSVFFIDLDDFKSVNDTFGHAVGDQVLIEVAERLRKVVRSIDTVARLGGDEFVAFCEGLPEAEVGEVVRRIKRSIGKPMVIDNLDVQIGASVGVERASGSSVTFDGLLTSADQAMYRQKRGS